VTAAEAKQWATEEGFTLEHDTEEYEDGPQTQYYITMLPWHLLKLFDRDVIPETEDQYWQYMADALSRWQS